VSACDTVLCTLPGHECRPEVPCNDYKIKDRDHPCQSCERHNSTRALEHLRPAAFTASRAPAPIAADIDHHGHTLSACEKGEKVEAHGHVVI
jgi:hypothetical protein